MFQGHAKPLLPHCSTLMIVNTGLVHTCTSSSRICISTCICVFAWKCLQMACCAAQLLGSAGKHLAAQAGASQIKLPVLIFCIHVLLFVFVFVFVPLLSSCPVLISLYLCVFYFVQLVLYLSDKQLVGYKNQIVFQCW